MRINLTSVLVDDQDKAPRFYTEVLGFTKRRELPAPPTPRCSEAEAEAEAGRRSWLSAVPTPAPR